jgi:hypothetical protein
MKDDELDVRAPQAMEDPYLRAAATIMVYVPVILGHMADDGFLNLEAMEAQIHALQKQSSNA